MALGRSKSFLKIIVRWRWTGALLGSNVTFKPVSDMGGGIKVLSSCSASGVALSFVADIA